MLGKANSPTAKLLRSSRLFSLPPPLPKPSLASEVRGVDSSIIRDSDTATLPYPVDQAIATPQSSQARGDWGLKRPLPLRTTAHSSNAVLRVTSIDSIEHITDFESATDHTKTLEKWQEIGLAVAPHSQRQTVSGRKGAQSNVFESEVDNTAKRDASERKRVHENHERWKFQGPWVSGMSEAAFARYVAKLGKHKRRGFLSYLREQVRQAEISAETIRARDEGRQLSPEFRDTYDISEEFFQDKLRRMRDEMIDNEGIIKLNCELSVKIREFFDLPVMSEGQLPTPTTFTEQAHQARAARNSLLDSSVGGPPKTHPSAGISYLRTNTHIPNHPLLGPQRYLPVLPMRVLKTRGGTAEDAASARYGVAGVVAASNRDPGAFHVKADLLAPGGIKSWAEIDRLSIDPTGRINAEIKPPDPDAVDINEGRLPKRAEDIKPIYQTRPNIRPIDVPSSGPRGVSGFYSRSPKDSVDFIQSLLPKNERSGEKGTKGGG